MRAFRPRPELFIDRNLGRSDVPSALRAAGLQVRTMAEVYGRREQDVPDVEWLALAGREGWLVLSKDKRIRRRLAEVKALQRFRVRAFVLTSGQLTSAEQAGRYLDNLDAIVEAADVPGAAVYAVHVDHIEKVWPREPSTP